MPNWMDIDISNDPAGIKGTRPFRISLLKHPTSDTARRTRFEKIFPQPAWVRGPHVRHTTSREVTSEDGRQSKLRKG